MRPPHESVAVLAGALLAMAVPIYWLFAILTGPVMQYGDYFGMLQSMFTPDGEFVPSGLLEHSNENFSAIPKLVYALNVVMFDGSNVSLGIIVWLLTVGLALVLVVALWPLFDTKPIFRVLLVWSLAVFVFPLGAGHTFVFSMAGTQWVLVNLFSAIAIVSLVRERPILAGSFGALATMSYGSGLAIWPVLVFLLWLQKRFGWRDGVMLGIGALSVALERVTASGVQAAPLSLDPLTVLRAAAVLGGREFSVSVDVAIIFGAIFLAVAAGVLLSAILERVQGRSPSRVDLVIYGLLAFTLVCITLIAVARANLGDNNQLASRYANLAALFSLAVVLASFWFLMRPAVWGYTVVTLIVLSLTAAVPSLSETKERSRVNQELGAITARLGIAEGIVFGYEEGVGEQLEALGHFPFGVAGSSLACGVLGETITPTQILRDADVQGKVESAIKIPDSSAASISGWLSSDESIECIVFLNAGSAKVVGGGVLGWPREDARLLIGGSRADIGWQGVARASSGAQLRTLFRLEGGERFIELGQVAVRRNPTSPDVGSSGAPVAFGSG